MTNFPALELLYWYFCVKLVITAKNQTLNPQITLQLKDWNLRTLKLRKPSFLLFHTRNHIRLPNILCYPYHFNDYIECMSVLCVMVWFLFLSICIYSRNFTCVLSRRRKSQTTQIRIKMWNNTCKLLKW